MIHACLLPLPHRILLLTTVLGSLLMASKASAQTLALDEVYTLLGPGAEVASATVDTNGNFYLFGRLDGTVDFDVKEDVFSLTSGGTDLFIAKYDADGDWQYAKRIRIDLPAETSTGAGEIAVDSEGNLYVCGSYQGTIFFEGSSSTEQVTNDSGQPDGYVAKYDAEGNNVFYYTFAEQGDPQNNFVTNVALAPDDHFYVLGRFRGTIDFNPTDSGEELITNQDNASDLHLTKFTTDGDYVKTIIVGGTDYEAARRLKVDDLGNVVIAGHFKNRTRLDPDDDSDTFVREDTRSFFVAKYNSDLELLHATPIYRSTDTTDQDLEGTIRLLVDESRDIYVSAHFTDAVDFDGEEQFTTPPGAEDDFFVAKYSADGELLFTRQYGGPGYEENREFALGDDGTIYLSGIFRETLDLDATTTDDNRTSAGEEDAFLATLTPEGDVQSVMHYSSDRPVFAKEVIRFGETVCFVGNFSETLRIDDQLTIEGNAFDEERSDAFIVKYDITSPTPPVVVSLSALSRYTGQVGDEVVLQGENFGETVADHEAAFGETAAEVSAVNEARTEVTVRVPNVAAGSYSVSLRVADTTLVADQSFVVVGSPPLITGLSPTVLKAETAGTLLISGENFGDAVDSITVVLGDAPIAATDIRVNGTGTQITITTPPLAVGEYGVQVSIGRRTVVADGVVTVTDEPIIDQDPPAIVISVPELLDEEEATFAVNNEVTDASEVNSVTVEFLPIRKNPASDDWRKINASREGETDTYIVQLADTDLDELGVQTRTIATDALGNSDTSAIQYTFRNYTNTGPLTLAGLAAAGSSPSANDYNLLAVPLQNQSVRQAFGELGNYDTQRWRAWQLSGSGQQDAPYQEFSRGWSGDLQAGQGYMLIYTEETDFRTTGRVVEATYEEPFTITLQPGFNLIGNPYPFALDWSAVLAFNDQNPDALRLKTFNNGFRDVSRLEAFEGALVVNPNDGAPVTLALPVGTVTNPGGRTSHRAEKEPAPTGEAWQLLLTLRGERLTTHARLGMHPRAQPEADRYDDFTPPRLADFLEFNSHHPDFFLPKFSQDVVPTATQHQWEWEVATSEPHQTVTLHWNPEEVAPLAQSLTLVDEQRVRTVNMREQSSYSFRVNEAGTYPLRVAYGDEALSDQWLVGEAYPNPAADQLYFPIRLPQGARLTLEVFDATGRQMDRQHYDQLAAGYQTLTWQRETAGQPTPAGLYLYRWRVEGTDRTFSGRVLLE